MGYRTMQYGAVAVLMTCFLLVGEQAFGASPESVRYANVTPEAAEVLIALSAGVCNDDPPTVQLAGQLQQGLCFHRWDELIPVIENAIERAVGAQKKTLQEYERELLVRAADADGIVRVPITVRALSCDPATTCSGPAPDFSQDMAILQAVQDGCSGIENACQGICSGSIIIPTGCSGLVVSCQNLASGLSTFCSSLEAGLSANCLALSGICPTQNLFSGIVPFVPVVPVCPVVPAPATAAIPVLPDVSGNKVLVCDIQATLIDAQVGLFETLGVIDDLNVSGNGIFGGDLDVDGNIVANGSLNLGSGVVAAGELDIAGDATIGGSLCVTELLSAASGLLVAGTASVSSNLLVGDSLFVNGDVIVGGSVNALSGINFSGPVCANDLVVERASIDTACIGQARVDGLRVVTACIDDASIGNLSANLICADDLVVDGCFEFDQAAMGAALIGTVSVDDLLAERACIGTACINAASIDSLESNTACLGNVIVDRIGGPTACFQNVDICQLLLQDLFVQNTVQFTVAPTAICGLPQGFGEILFLARDFCQPLCPAIIPLLTTGCQDVMAFNTVAYPYNFSTSCAPQEIICGVPLPQCSGTSNVGYLPHVDFIVPEDYNDNFQLAVYLLGAPGATLPTGAYELRSQIVDVPVSACTVSLLENSSPFSLTAICTGIGATFPIGSPGVVRFDLQPDTAQAMTLAPGDWMRIALDLASEPAGLTGCRPLISAMVFRYARKNLDQAFTIFPG